LLRGRDSNPNFLIQSLLPAVMDRAGE